MLRLVFPDGHLLVQQKTAVFSSWPGIGLQMTMGSPVAKASELVIPPGLVTMKSDAHIKSTMLCTNGKRWTWERFSVPGIIPYITVDCFR